MLGDLKCPIYVAGVRLGATCAFSITPSKSSEKSEKGGFRRGFSVENSPFSPENPPFRNRFSVENPPLFGRKPPLFETLTTFTLYSNLVFLPVSVPCRSEAAFFSAMLECLQAWTAAVAARAGSALVGGAPTLQEVVSPSMAAPGASFFM